MGLRRIGNRLVAEGASEYTRSMGQAADANRRFGESAGQAGPGIDRLNTKSTALAVAAGTVLAGAIQKAIGSLVNFGRQSMQVVMVHERLEQSMTSLVAKEVMTAGATDDMTKALELAAPRAQELLKWIQELAIKSPFDQQGVAQALKTAMAYGFTTAEAQKLAQASIDFTTATGASGHVMGQIALALGQVKARGKLAGQEILQLVNAGVNANAMLKEMGYTLDDVSKGVVSADEFIAKFTETMDRDFGGAAARSSETLGGLMNSLGDIKEMALKALYMPSIQAVLPILGQVTTAIQNLIPKLEAIGKYFAGFVKLIIDNREAILKFSAVIGAMIAVMWVIINASAIWSAILYGVQIAIFLAFKGIVMLGSALLTLLSPIYLIAGAVAVLVGAFAMIGIGMSKAREQANREMSVMSKDFGLHQTIMEGEQRLSEERRIASMGEFGDKIRQTQAQQNSETAAESRSWGENIIIQFAEGMASAIAAVISILIDLGNQIAYWLSPGSPPRILPEIDKWGEMAMQEFIDGMGKAHFGVFRDLTSTLTGYLRSMGDVPETEVVPRIIRMRKAVMEATNEYMRTGNVGEAAFEKIFQNLGGTNHALNNYIRALIRVQTAQEQLNKITEKYKNLTDPLNQELQDIAKKREKYTQDKRKEELQKILDDANAPAEAKEFALMELREMAIKEQLAGIEERKKAETDAANEELTAAQEQMEVQKALIDAQMEQNNLIKEQLRLLERLANQGGGGGGGGPKGGGGGLPTIDKPGGLFGGLTAGMDDLKTRIQDLMDEIRAPFEELEGDFISLGETWNTVKNNLIARLWTLIEVFGILREIIIKVIQIGIQKVLDFIARMEEGKEAWRGIFRQMGEIADRIWLRLKIKASEAIEAAKLKILSFKESVSIQFLLIQGKITKFGNHLKTKISEALDAVKTKASEAWDGFKSKIDEAVGKVQELWDRFMQFAAWLTGTKLEPNMSTDNIPDPYQNDSPLRMHTRFMDFEKYLNGTTFNPTFEPVTPPAGAGQIAQQTTINNYNNQQVQGIGSANISGGVGMDTLEIMIERVLAKHLT